jgi:hypothetical protein
VKTHNEKEKMKKSTKITLRRDDGQKIFIKNIIPI